MSLGDIFGKGSIAEQLFVWNILGQVVTSLAQPGFVELSKLANNAVPVMPMNPADAAAAHARGYLAAGDAADNARDSGIPGDVFRIMTQLSAHAPDLSIAFEAYRRKVIPAGSNDPTEVSLRGALTDAGIPDSWHDVITKLAVSIPSQAEVLNAWLEGQITAGEARRRLTEAGMDPTWIQSAYDANGQAPTPTQALDLLNRGIIERFGSGPNSTSYEQAFLEGPWRNKWLHAFLALAEYLPPPRTVTAMYHGGQIDHALAADLLSKQGLRPQLVAAYLAPAQSHAAASDKHLAKTEIVSLFEDRLLSKAEAIKSLEQLKYTAHDAALIIELADVRVITAQVRAGVNRVRAFFEAGKVNATEARDTLATLGVSATQARELVDTWSLVQTTRTRDLTPAQIESAFVYGLIRADDAMVMLQQIGYDAFEAYIALSVRVKGPVQGLSRPASPYPPPSRKATP